MIIFALLAFSAGAAIALQAAMNAQLGVLLNSFMLGASVAFLCASAFAVSVVVASSRSYPHMADIRSVPLYLWFSGGALSAFGVGIFYFLIPKMGVGSMMSYALTGQILMAIVASHFGWFNQPIKPIDIKIIAGVIALVLGILLINWEVSHTHGSCESR